MMEHDSKNEDGPLEAPKDLFEKDLTAIMNHQSSHELIPYQAQLDDQKSEVSIDLKLSVQK